MSNCIKFGLSEQLSSGAHTLIWLSAQISLAYMPFYVVPWTEFQCLIMCFHFHDTGVGIIQERLINLSFLLICLLLGSYLHIRTHCYSSTKQSCHHGDSFHISPRNQLCFYSSGESIQLLSMSNIFIILSFIHMTFFLPV